MTGEIPFYGMTGNQLWARMGQSIQQIADRQGLRIEVGEASGAWTGVTYPGRGRVLQVRINARSLRCYPYGVEPSEQYQALEHEPSKCSKSWKKRFPSMFTLEAPEQLPLATELVEHVLRKVSAEDPLPSAPPLMVLTPSS